METMMNGKKGKNNIKDSFFAKLSDATVSTPATNINQIKTGRWEIVVKGKTIEFERKDPIFNLKGPVIEKYPSDKWNLCDKEFKKSSKKQRYCDFWGHSYWKDWFKSRPFPRKDNDGNTTRGEIWMIWDRKFIAKDVQLFYEEQIEKKENKIKISEKELADKVGKLDIAINKIDILQKDDQNKQIEYETEMEDLNLKMEVIQNKIRELTNENDKLQRRIQIRNEEAKKKQDEQITLNEDSERLKNEISSFESKFTKLKVKYDEVWAASGKGRGRKAKQHKELSNGRNSETAQSNDTFISNKRTPDSHYSNGMSSKYKQSIVKRGQTESIISINSKDSNTGNKDFCKKWYIF